MSGVRKASIPGKIALRVADGVKPGVVLDLGDLLLSAGGREVVRLQSAYLNQGERQPVFRVREALKA